MYALVDCNNFFVSCERVFRPDLDGQPVVVLSNNDGCVVARSNESKAMGIKMGTPFFQVKHLVEQGRLHAFSSNYSLYGDISSRVMSILSDTVPHIEIYSIDEAFLHLDGVKPDEMLNLCRGLVAKVRRWVGVPVSIGVAPTKTLAKLASHFAKTYKGYRGVCMMDDDAKRVKALGMSPIGEVWGIGRRLVPKMQGWGIATALDFVQRPRKWVADNLGMNGLKTWEELNGNPCVAEEKEGGRRLSGGREEGEAAPGRGGRKERKGGKRGREKERKRRKRKREKGEKKKGRRKEKRKKEKKKGKREGEKEK